MSSFLTNLKIPEYTDNNSKSENITEPIIKIILEYTDHLSILTIGEVCKESSSSPFPLLELYKEEILKDTLNLDTFKSCQDTDVPRRVNKENTEDIFAELLSSSVNESVRNSKFPAVFEQASSF